MGAGTVTALTTADGADAGPRSDEQHHPDVVINDSKDITEGTRAVRATATDRRACVGDEMASGSEAIAILVTHDCPRAPIAEMPAEASSSTTTTRRQSEQRTAAVDGDEQEVAVENGG
ncbi:hypothetical protein WOLCODRAFT_151405 [Wolfiporia cocos MD-104 SS10]|uniref:Uncharacterized protein n=1 Tax=Wolfiporia cocos (strain MD-104) TaxID=742152 RepID=A0A2H3JGN4_WOLCO|nr:hypothetical protein WOLCODRAFT_151405 [Wolfiporia cocos MD-104 SS10]